MKDDNSWKTLMKRFHLVGSNHLGAVVAVETLFLLDLNTDQGMSRNLIDFLVHKVGHDTAQSGMKDNSISISLADSSFFFSCIPFF
jgi:hypothetical protein